MAKFLAQYGRCGTPVRVELSGTVDRDRLRPDFSFIDDAGDVIIWEHLGMLDRPDYAAGWDWKRAWFERNGFTLGGNVFTTSEIGGLDMREVEATASAVKAALAKDGRTSE